MMVGALLGAVLRRVLPKHHLADDTKDVIKLGAGLVGTMAALVLGLLIASAKSSFDTQSTQLKQLAVKVVLLDEVLAQYGPEARPARDRLRQAIGPVVEQIWRENKSDAPRAHSFRWTTGGEEAFEALEALTPQTDNQTSLKARAIQVSSDLAQTRLV